METPIVKLVDHLKAQGATKVVKVSGPNGAFMSILMKDGSKKTMPIGKKSQEGEIKDYNVLITDDGVAIATTNNYAEVEALDL